MDTGYCCRYARISITTETLILICRAVVNFDLDHGPVVEGVFPPLFLLSSESENMLR
jgi:hypothetical protein